jgi:hypothetical protein
MSNETATNVDDDDVHAFDENSMETNRDHRSYLYLNDTVFSVVWMLLTNASMVDNHRHSAALSNVYVHTILYSC